MPSRLYVVSPEDNVATAALDDVNPGTAYLQSGKDGSIKLLDPIPFGHKAAIIDIPAGAPIVKYGVTIAIAIKDIRCGEHVHIHNAKSMHDARSNTFATTGVGMAGSTDREYTL